VWQALKMVLTYTPSPEFLSDIAAVEGVILGLLVPVSFDIVARLSERYNSGSVTAPFQKQVPVRLLSVVLVVNIVLALLLRYFGTDILCVPIWRASALLLLVMFILIAILVLRVINKIRLFLTKPDFLLDTFFKEGEKYVR
jgi:hypothetical protein